MGKPRHSRLQSGAGLLDCMRLTRQLGGSAEPIRGTGEYRFSHPRVQARIVVNARRKDASRALVSWLNGLTAQ